LVNTLLEWLLALYVFSFWGLRPQTPTRALPLDPAGGLLSSVPVLSPSKQISGYASGCTPITNTENHKRTTETGGQGETCPPKIREKYFSGNCHVKFGHFSGKYHVKFGNFVNFSRKYHKNSRGHFDNFSDKYHVNLLIFHT